MFTYQLIDGGFLILRDGETFVTQTGNPEGRAVNGELPPFAEDKREAAAQAAVAFYELMHAPRDEPETPPV